MSEGTAIGELSYLLSHLDAIGKPDDYVVISNTCGWANCIRAGHLRELYRLARLGAALKSIDKDTAIMRNSTGYYGIGEYWSLDDSDGEIIRQALTPEELLFKWTDHK